MAGKRGVRKLTIRLTFEDAETGIEFEKTVKVRQGLRLYADGGRVVMATAPHVAGRQNAEYNLTDLLGVVEGREVLVHVEILHAQ